MRSGSARCRSPRCRWSRTCTPRPAGRPLLRPRYLDDTAASARLGANPRSRLVVLADRRNHMRIGFVINSIATEKPEYTTVRLTLQRPQGSRHLDDEGRRPRKTRRRDSCRTCPSRRSTTTSARKRFWKASKTQNTVATTSRSTISKCWQCATIRQRTCRNGLGGHVGSAVRAALRSRGHIGRERPRQPRQCGEQDLLPALSRISETPDAHLSRSRRYQRLRQGNERRRSAQTPAGIGWHERLLRLQRRVDRISIR